MEFEQLFKQFESEGRLALCQANVPFCDIPWSRHPVFEGVELKHLVSGGQTEGQFSYHLVRIAPNCSIGSHVHEGQLETHEVIAGDGVCMNDGSRIPYGPGVITILAKGRPHEVTAGGAGLCLFAKFIPALT